MAVLNKIDLVQPTQLDALQKSLTDEFGIASPIPVSAMRGDGLGKLLSRLEAQLPCGPKLYPDDMVAEQPERFFAAERIREVAFEHLEDELPYAINIHIEEFRQRPGHKTYIRAIIYVGRESQKGIVIGKKGMRLRAIGRKARAASGGTTRRACLCRAVGKSPSRLARQRARFTGIWLSLIRRCSLTTYPQMNADERRCKMMRFGVLRNVKTAS